MPKKLCDIIQIDELETLDINENNRKYDLSKFLDSCEIVKIEVNKKKNSCMFKVVAYDLIEFSFIKKLSEYIKKQTGLYSVDIQIEFVKCDIHGYLHEIIAEVINKYANLKSVLVDCDPKIVDDYLDIYLHNNGTRILYIKKIDEYITGVIKNKFGRVITTRFISIKDDTEKTNSPKEIEKEVIKATSKKVKKSNGKNVKKNNQILYGKTIKTEKTNISMIDMNEDTVTIEGEVFAFSKKQLKSGKMLFAFGVTDKVSSIHVKVIFEEDKNPELTESAINGNYIKVRGKIQYDTFSHEKILMARDIMYTKKIERIDDHEEKRVELHAHTQMSAMDAVCDTEKLIKQAMKWGHRSIAITDHGVLHAYPDAFKAASENNFKVIYGVEGYLIDDLSSIVINYDERDINTVYSVIDIETTGLSMYYDKITEIGAVKIKDGQIVNTFSSLVDPRIPIPLSVQELTGITDIMVKDAKTIDIVLPELLDFIGSDCIVAHNASFDISFLKREAGSLGMQILNPVLDTLAMSKALLTELKRNKLATVARKLNIKVETQHRALGDAITTANVLKKFIEIINFKKDITKLKELNDLIDTKNNYKNAKVYHVILLVKNKEGLKNLYKIVSRSQLDYFHKRPRIPKKLLEEHRDGLLIGSACYSGEIFQAILSNKDENVIQNIAEFYDYFEIQPTDNNVFLVRRGEVKSIEQLKNINIKIVGLGEKLDKKVVATCDVHFIEKEESILREILLTGGGYDDASDQSPLFFRTTNEMLDEFSYLGEEKAFEIVVTNTNYIESIIEIVEPIPRGRFPPRIENSENIIKEMTYRRAYELYGEPLHNIIKERIEKELEAIIKHGFSVMYIIAHKLVKKSLDDGFLVGSRGSVGSSLVAFLIEITEVNSLAPHYVCPDCFFTEFSEDDEYECGFDLPDKKCSVCNTEMRKDGYDIPFETFLGFDGDKEPDIDLNFSGHYQERAHRFTEELFGKDHVYRAGTVSRLASQTAFGYVKKFMESKELDLPKSEIERLTEGCMGVRKTTGQHPGGIMIVPQDMEIYDFSPIGYPADDTSSNTVTTHFDYRFLHGSILKLDILGHDDPTMINTLEKYTDKKVSEITIGDKNVMEIFRNTKPLKVSSDEIGTEVGTLGIPEFGTGFVRGMLFETKPETYAELIKISGLSHGTDVWLGNAQKLIHEKTTTLKNAICCRDDIMIYLLHKGINPALAFQIMENVRNGMGLKDDMIAEMKKNKVPNWYIWSCQQMKYVFPKAHAAAYVSMAFRIAWYKVNEPLGYYAAYFTTRCDEFDAKLMIHGKERAAEYLNTYRRMEKLTQREKNMITILEVVIEMYARGFEFLSVDIYLSHSLDFIIENDKIRPPLRTISGLGENVAANIERSREESTFVSIEDLSSRAKASKAIIEAMQEEGCLADLPASNQLSLF